MLFGEIFGRFGFLGWAADLLLSVIAVFVVVALIRGIILFLQAHAHPDKHHH